MIKKINNIRMLIKEAGKPGIKITFFSLFKMIFEQLTDCGVSLLLPVLIINSYENNRYLELVYMILTFFSGVLLLSILFDRVNSIYICKQYTEVSKKILSKIFFKITDSDISRFDDAIFYEKHIFNMNKIEEKVIDGINNMSEAISCIIIFCLNLSLVITVSKKAWLFVLVSLMLTSALQFFQTRFNMLYQKKAIPFNRRAEVLGHFFMDYDYAKEIKNPKREQMLFEQILLEKESALNFFNKSKPKFIGYSFGKSFTSIFLLKVIFLVYLTYRCLVFKDYSYASVIVVYNATINLYGILNNFMNTFSKYDDISLYAEQYFEIMKYENEIISGDKVLDYFESLEFRNVSFNYEGTNNLVLDNVSFKINRGQKIALVGRNGNGKTTIIKLILRMYEPQSGEILVNSINIKEYDINCYRHFFGVLFQDSGMYNATIKDNICFGKEPCIDLNNVIQDVGMKDQIESLKNKEDSEYGVDIFEHGVVFSGGEQQRLLVARALAKNANIILMDEPTSHIDPTADITFSNMIFDKLEGKTVLYITHRLISTQKADSIIVLNNDGKIESGKHNELLINSQLYRNMYEAQEKNMH